MSLAAPPASVSLPRKGEGAGQVCGACCGSRRSPLRLRPSPCLLRWHGGSPRSARRRSGRGSPSPRWWSIGRDGCCGPTRRWRAAGGCRRRARGRSALSRAAARLRGQALRAASRRRSAGARPRGLAARRQRPHRLRRLHAHHAGGAAARAARRTQSLTAKLRQMVRAIEIEQRAEQGRDPRALSDASRPMAAISKACAPRRSPISARSRAA